MSAQFNRVLKFSQTILLCAKFLQRLLRVAAVCQLRKELLETVVLDLKPPHLFFRALELDRQLSLVVADRACGTRRLALPSDVSVMEIAVTKRRCVEI